MDTSPNVDLAVPVRYTLTHRAAAEDRVDLVLDLFRGAVQIHTRTIASVDREQAVLVMAKCRRYLQLRGVDASAPVVPAVSPAKPASRPAVAPSRSSMASPTVTPMRPAAGVKPMAIPDKAPTAKSAVGKVPSAKLPASGPSLLAARATAARSAAARQERGQERSQARGHDAAATAPAAAAFDWMFQAV